MISIVQIYKHKLSLRYEPRQHFRALKTQDFMTSLGWVIRFFGVDDLVSLVLCGNVALELIALLSAKPFHNHEQR